MTVEISNETRQEQGEALVEPRLNDTPAKAKPASSGKHWLFDVVKAKEMAQKSKEARARREQEADQALEMVKQLKAAAIVEPSDSFRLNRLALVRSQLAKVDTELDELLDDPKADQSRLKAILEASKVLSEQERKLDNRPDPGSHRPSAAKTKRTTPENYGPVE